MAEPISMKIIEVCKVIPVDSPSQFSLPLTFLDRFWLRTNPVAGLFFYELPEPNTDFMHTILPNLKHSLSLTLQYYLPLAGNLTWPQDSNLPIVQYSTGDGISLTIAETLADFDHLSGHNFRKAEELRSLLPNFPYSQMLIPAMSLQITLFPKRGFSIGYIAHHAVMDGKSMSMFLNSWAYICINGNSSVLPLELIPSFDRTFVEQQVELEKVYPKGLGPIDPESKILPLFDTAPPCDTMLGTFRLTEENIEVLKSKAKTSTRASTFTVTSAYVAICLIMAKNVTADLTYIGFSADCRLRLDPPLPPTYFGNCLVVCGGVCDTKELLVGDGFVTAVSVITEALARLNEGVVKVVERISRDNPYSASKSFVTFPVSSPRFEKYKVDFGWGKPRKVEVVSIHKGAAFHLSDDRDGDGGIEIGVALEKHETEAFASLFADGLKIYR